MWQKDGAKWVMVAEISKPFGSPKAIYEFNWFNFFAAMQDIATTNIVSLSSIWIPRMKRNPAA